MELHWASRSLAVIIGLLVACTTACASITFGDFSNFTINKNDSGVAPTTSSANASIQLVSGFVQKRSIFYDLPQDISQFSVSFAATASSGDGVCFVLQNSPAGANAVGGFAGYSGITKSAAVGLLTFTGTTGGSGLFTNGSLLVNNGTSTMPVALNSSTINVTLTYDGSRLSETLSDPKKGTSYSTSYVVDLMSILGSPTAFVGFTAATATDPGTNETISSFQFSSSVPEPAYLGVLMAGMTFGLIRRIKGDAK